MSSSANRMPVCFDIVHCALIGGSELIQILYYFVLIFHRKYSKINSVVNRTEGKGMSFEPALMNAGNPHLGTACSRLTCFSAHGVIIH